MSNYGGIDSRNGNEEKTNRSALLAGLGAVSALLLVFALAVSHLSEAKV